MSGSTADIHGNPWRRRSRATVYLNDWIEVMHDEVTRPDGSDGIYGVVHFHDRAVGVLAVDANGRILLVGQFRYTLDEYSWEIPEGGVPPGEDLLGGAKRELAEETGFSASTWRLLVPRVSLSNSVGDQTGCIFIATDLEAGDADPEPSEQIELRWVTLVEGLSMIGSGEIHDSVTQVGILRYAVEP
jgi:8-oxo-dGTP pyrophosphatase MutT (NUDIX family)